MQARLQALDHSIDDHACSFSVAYVPSREHVNHIFEATVTGHIETGSTYRPVVFWKHYEVVCSGYTVAVTTIFS